MGGRRVNRELDHLETGKEVMEKTGVDFEFGTIPKHLTGYWKQRYSLFSKFDDGIVMDEGWFLLSLLLGMILICTYWSFMLY